MIEYSKKKKDEINYDYLPGEWRSAKQPRFNNERVNPNYHEGWKHVTIVEDSSRDRPAPAHYGDRTTSLRFLPDSQRLGTQRFIAQTLLTNSNPNWALCTRHSEICVWNPEYNQTRAGVKGHWTSWTNDVHSEELGCVLVPIPASDLDLYTNPKVAELLNNVKEISESFLDAGMRPGQGDLNFPVSTSFSEGHPLGNSGRKRKIDE